MTHCQCKSEVIRQLFEELQICDQDRQPEFSDVYGIRHSLEEIIGWRILLSSQQLIEEVFPTLRNRKVK